MHTPERPSDQRPAGFMSVDVEEWFTVLNFQNTISKADWPTFELRSEPALWRLLDLFARHRVSATFFVLGWLAERIPHVLQEIHQRGHEIASHGYSHAPVTQLTPDEFRRELDQSLQAITACGVPTPIGFRAPSFSITRQTMWALDILKERGFVYDSSIFPVGFHPDYGIAEAPLDPYLTPGGLVEFPLSVVDVAGKRLPCSGGGYFRLLPYAASHWLMQRAQRQDRTINFYLHPWELDPDQPRRDTGSRLKNLRHYVGLSAMEQKLERVCTDVCFGNFRDYLRNPPSTLGRQRLEAAIHD